MARPISPMVTPGLAAASPSASACSVAWIRLRAVVRFHLQRNGGIRDIAVHDGAQVELDEISSRQGPGIVCVRRAMRSDLVHGNVAGKGGAASEPDGLVLDERSQLQQPGACRRPGFQPAFDRFNHFAGRGIGTQCFIV